MAGKRKRKRPGQVEGDQKRQKVSSNSGLVVKDSLLAKFYPQVLSLREYLLSKLPKTSKVRRKKIISVGKKIDGKKTEQELAKFLDQTLVGVSKFKDLSQDERWKQWTTFSQRPDDSVSFANLSGVGTYSQTEVCLLSIAHWNVHIWKSDIDIIRSWTSPSGYSSQNLPMGNCSTFYVKAFGRMLLIEPSIKEKMPDLRYQVLSQHIRTVM